MAVLHPVVLGLRPRRVPRQAPWLAQGGEAGVPAGDDLVDVCLVAGVPEDEVLRRGEHPVERQGELDHSEVGSEVAASHGDRLHDELPNLRRKLFQLLRTEPP